MQFSMTIFAYLGPETMLPMTSIVAGAIGVVMMFGRASMRWASGTIRKVTSMTHPRSRTLKTTRKIGQAPLLPVTAHSSKTEPAHS